LRYGGVFAVSLAYAGTGSDIAIKRLLNVAVSDVSDDVRRVAVIGLGFILFRTPAQVPKVVELLSSSYNPHVRYGACMALGISCSGTSNTVSKLFEGTSKCLSLVTGSFEYNRNHGVRSG